MFKEIDYTNMPEETFKHIYLDCILKENYVQGCIPHPAFDRACEILAKLGFTKIDIEQTIEDPETVLTYVISSNKHV